MFIPVAEVGGCWLDDGSITVQIVVCSGETAVGRRKVKVHVHSWQFPLTIYLSNITHSHASTLEADKGPTHVCRAITSCRLASTTTVKDILCPLNPVHLRRTYTHIHLPSNGGVECVSGCALGTPVVKRVVSLLGTAVKEMERYSVQQRKRNNTNHT